MTTIAIYARKSRFSVRSESVATQITLCREHCQRLFPEASFQIYGADEGYSGKNTDRPDFQRLVDDIKARKINAVCVYRLDRISRSVADFCELLDLFQRYQVSFVSLRENFDTSTPMGRAMVYISSVISQLERETLAERVKDAVYEMAKSGRWLGGLTPTGFEAISVPSPSNPTKTMAALSVLEEELQIVRTVVMQYLELGSLSKLYTYCLAHGITSRNGAAFSRTTLRNLLTNPVYCTADAAAYAYFSSLPCQLCAEEADFDGTHGIMPFNRTSKSSSSTLAKPVDEWIIAVGAHPGTFPGSVWVRVQQMIAQNKELGRSFQTSRTESALLSGLIRCAHCGSVMRPKAYGHPYPDGSRRFAYVCTCKIDTKGAQCSMVNAPGRDTDAAVIAHLAGAAASFAPNSTAAELIGAAPAEDVRQTIRMHENAISSAQRKIDNLINAIADPTADIHPAVRDRILAQTNDLQLQISDHQSAIASLNASLMDADVRQALASHLSAIFADFGDRFSSLSYDEKRRLIRSVVDSITWDGENLTVDVLGASTLPK